MSNIFTIDELRGYSNVNTPATGQRVAGEAGIVHSTPIIDPTKSVVQQPAQVQQKQQSQPTLDVNSSTAGMDYLNSLYTSKEDEDKLRKASVMNQRILAIGDAIRHIGNIANAAKGAPSQQFNNPVLEEQARYERGKALRDKANQQYFTYQQQKAAQEARTRQLQAQADYQAESLGIRKAEHQRLIGAQKLAERKQEFYEKLKQEQYELDKAYKEHKMTWEEYNARSRRISADAAWLRAEKYVPGGQNGVGGYTVTEETQVHRDKFGKETGRTKTKTRTGSNGQSTTTTTTTKGNNTPPSRRNSNSQNSSNNNVPPSRRNR